jgi:hypothetical protein
LVGHAPHGVEYLHFPGPNRHDQAAQGLLERDAENSYLTTDTVPEDPMNQLLGHSITYRIAVGPQTGRKVFA